MKDRLTCVRRRAQALAAVLFAMLFMVFAGGHGPAGLAAAQDIAAPVQENDEYLLGSGDKLKITVFGEEDLSGEFQIDGVGNLSFPLLGDIRAGGMSLRVFVASLEARLLDGYLRNPRVSAEVVNYRPFTILGEVRQPGRYPYVNGMSVFEAVGQAGGFTYRADESEVEIKRNNSTKRYPVNESTKILPGDVVRVSERFF